MIHILIAPGIFDYLFNMGLFTLTQFSKFNNFLWVCWFLGKNLSNFLPPVWKLHNSYCHNFPYLCQNHVQEMRPCMGEAWWIRMLFYWPRVNKYCQHFPRVHWKQNKQTKITYLLLQNYIVHMQNYLFTYSFVTYLVIHNAVLS